MNLINSFIQKEKAHFNRLDQQAQSLLGSIALYYLISPIFGIFINAFIWRQAHDPILVAFYNIVGFLCIPCGFYLNGLLLQKYSPHLLYFIGFLLYGITICTLLFLPHLSYTTIAIFGFFNGVAGGCYWADRNLLTLKTTKSDNRIYFSGIESILGTYSKILIPLLIGWFLILGSQTSFYSVLQGYQMLGIFILIVICLTGVVIRSFKMKHHVYRQLWLTNPSPNWQKFRLLQIILGFMQGIAIVLSTLMVLILLGKEDTLGTVTSISYIITTIVVYILAKRLHIKHRITLLEISFFIGLVGAVAFSILYSGIGVLIFYAAQAVMQPFIWMATNSINYDLIDEDKDGEKHYAYISDQEIYLNGGRIIAIVIFILLIKFVSSDVALRYTPLVFAFSQIFLQLLARSIDKKKV